MNKKSKCTIKINNKISNFFYREEGDPLCPTLFNMFVYDRLKELNVHMRISCA